MDEKEFFQWLRENALLDAVNRYYPSFEVIIENNLSLKEEKALIYTDLGEEGKRVAPLMAACYYLALKIAGKEAEFMINDKSIPKKEFNEFLAEKFLNFGEKNLIVLCMSGKIGSLRCVGKTFRAYAKQRKHKFITAPGLLSTKTELFPSLVDVLLADPDKMHARGERIKDSLDKASTVRITTPLGTDLIISKKGIKSIINSGLYKYHGEGGNLPAGEVYFCPEGKTNVNGKVVIDGSIRTHKTTLLVKTPVIFIIKDGEIVDIQGNQEAKALIESLEKVKKKAFLDSVMKIAEIGIGINPSARILGSTVVNEKSLGTAHIANGSNHFFGGSVKSSVHFDHVFRNPSIYVDGDLLRI